MSALVRSRYRDFAAGLTALVLGGVLVVGVPILLWRLGGWPLPGKIPSIDGVRNALSRSSVPDVVIVKALALVGWTAWLLLCWSLVVETWAWVSGRPSPSLRFAGPTQAFARQLITSISLMASLTLSPMNSSPALATAGAAVTSPQARPAAPTPAAVAVVSAAETSAPVSNGPTYTVQRRDSLWRIAESQLGDPLRWRDVWDINRDRDFNGVKFTNANLIYPGWELELPAPSIAAQPAPTPSAAAAPTEPGTPQPTRPVDPSTPAPAVTPDSTTTASVTAATTSTTAAEPGQSHQGSDDHRNTSTEDGSDRRGIALFSGGTILASALVILLTRLRRSQSRRRKPGRAPHRPLEATSTIETALRHDADVPRLNRLNAALRAFASGLPNQSLPEIAAVRVAQSEVEILLSSPTLSVPAGFEDRGDHRAFATEADLSSGTLEALGADTPAPWPTVVSVGNLGPDTVLVDLETAGLVTVDGTGAKSTVRRMAAELAASPLSEMLDIVVVADGFDLAASHRVRLVSTPDLGIDAIEQAVTGSLDVLQRIGVTDTPTARCARSSEHAWGVTVLVSLEPFTEGQVSRLSELLVPGRGAAALVVGPAAKDRWALSVNGTVHLRPHNFELEAVPLAEADLGAVSDLLSDAAVGDADEAIFDETPPPTDSVYVQPSAGQPHVHADFDVEVRVLGSVDIQGVAPINRRRTLELIAFLALHPCGVTGSQLKTAIWPEGVPTQDTFNVNIYRARSSLGVDREGSHHLPHAVMNDMAYSVGKYVTTDLARFTSLVARSRSATDQDDEADLLDQAIQLLRGQPFEGVSGYEWAYTGGTVAELEATISDAAHRLAQLALEVGDHKRATWSALQGLKAVPGSEPLYRDRMEAAHLAGDPAAVDRIVEELCRYIETLDPLDDLHPETIELWRRIGRPPSPPNTG